MNAIDAIATASDSTVEFVTSAQERVLEGLRSITSAFDTEAASALVDWIPAARPEGVRELVEASFSLNSRLIEANRTFAVGVLEALRPTSSN